MTREEVKAVLAIITEMYPNFNPGNIKNTVDLWSVYLADDDAGVIKQALDNYIKTDTTGFAPSVGQLRQKAVPEAIDNTEEAIALIRKAAANGLYSSEREFSNLPEDVKLAVGTADNLKAWAVQDATEFESVTLSHIRRAYRNIQQRKHNEAKALPLTSERLKLLQDRALSLGENDSFKQ